MAKSGADYFNAIVPAHGFALGIHADGDWVREIVFLPPQYERMPDNPLAMETMRQLRAWLSDPHFEFGLPLMPSGTPFQRRVWAAIDQIPCGETRSYGDIAKAIRSAPRAVGGACGANLFPIVSPCHRVVSKSADFNNGLGGFARAGSDGLYLDIKRWLLQHEQAHARS